MAEIARYVIDASVAVKWLLRLRDEPFTEQADAVLADYRDGRIELLAPEHIRSEVGHALRRATRRQRITQHHGRAALERFYAWRIPAVGDDALQLGGWDYCHRFSCSYYDGLYLALADMAGCPFIHADAKLRRTLGDHFPAARWIEDYEPAVGV